jgi:hypothetical protein
MSNVGNTTGGQGKECGILVEVEGLKGES